MKAKFTLLAILVVAFFSGQAQTIPNAGFETWTNPLTPDGWATLSSAVGFNIGLCEKDSLDKVVGANSVKLYSDTIVGQPSYGVVGGQLYTGSGSAPQGAPVFAGIPFAFRPDTIFFAYKYTTTVADTAIMSIKMTKNGTTVWAGGYPSLGLPLDTSSQWVLVYVPITSFYSNSTITPDTLLLRFSSSLQGQGQRVLGSVLHVDQVFFSASAVNTGVNDIANNFEVSVFPNPASEMLNIKSDASLESHQVVITDINGRLVRIRPLTNGVNSIELSDVASGTYIYRIADKNGFFIKQDRFNVVK